MKIKTVLFDLDGTITDPGLGITNSVMYALKHYGISVADRSELYDFIGPPLIDSFEKHFGFSKEKATEAVTYYREYYQDKGIFENTLYEEVISLLASLKREGYQIAMATSKPEIFAKKIAEHFGFAEYFNLIAGAEMNETRTHKDEVIAYALDLLKITDNSEVVMVGDRSYDVLGAKKLGIKTVGVLYGYGDEEELTKAGAAFIAKTPKDVFEKIKEL